MIPKPIRRSDALTPLLSFTESKQPADLMFVIQVLHPDGWREQGRCNSEYWAHQEAQTRCCSDGRHYRIVHPDNSVVIATVDTTCCPHRLLKG